MEEKPNYYAIIPANIRYDDDLKLGEKMMYGEITALTSKTGECWASNNYFSKLYNVTPQAISKWIKTLEEKKYILISYQRNGKSIIKRIIKMVSTPVDRVSTGIDRGINSSLEGYQPEIKDNNINNNNINNKENNNINIITKEKKKKTIDIGNVTNFYNYISNNQDIEMYLEDKRLLREKIEEWFKYKDERKEIYQETSIKTLTNRIIARAQEYGYKSVIEIIDLSISSDWQGIVWDKLEKLKENKNEKENETIIRGRIYE